MDAPEVNVAPVLPMEPMVAMTIFTSMGKDQGTDAACVLAVTALMEILNLEAPLVVVGHQGATMEELAEEDLAEGHP